MGHRYTSIDAPGNLLWLTSIYKDLSGISPKVRHGVVVGVHLLADVPGLPGRAVAILLHPPIAKVVLPPPPLIPASAEGLSLECTSRDC